jgi:hypothetical protein
LLKKEEQNYNMWCCAADREQDILGSNVRENSYSAKPIDRRGFNIDLHVSPVVLLMDKGKIKYNCINLKVLLRLGFAIDGNSTSFRKGQVMVIVNYV